MGSASSRTVVHRPRTPPPPTTVAEPGMQQPRWSSTGENSREERGTDSRRTPASRGALSSDLGPLLRGGGNSFVSFPCPAQQQSESTSPAELEIGGIGPSSFGGSSYPRGPAREIRGEDERDVVFGEGSRRSLDDEDLRLHGASETTLVRRQRVNEMRERLRRCAGFPPALDLQELESRGLMASQTVEAQRRMEVMAGTMHQGLFSSSSGSSREEMAGWAAPSSMRGLDSSDLWEGRYAAPSNTTAGGRSSPPMGDRLRRGSTSGRESRRTSGRRLWDALSRATSHRRSTTTTTASVREDNALDAMALDSGVDTGVDNVASLHGSSRALDLEERRRRVRSQVWALRRLSNGLEGVPWHSRTCTGSHHPHRCSCDAHGMVDDTNTRASISRIIMLAEALFEVLDEIHRQSVALSRSSTPASRASLPAPSPVVDAFPTRIHSVACTEALQCHICLVDYEDGDQIRVLPCQHEYHKACVDKWLKEVHRVCPLCRGDVCDLKPSVEPSVVIGEQLTG